MTKPQRRKTKWTDKPQAHIPKVDKTLTSEIRASSLIGVLSTSEIRGWGFVQWGFVQWGFVMDFLGAAVDYPSSGR